MAAAPAPPTTPATIPPFSPAVVGLGLKHGRFIKQQKERPLGDLYVTMLHRFGIPARSFADNAGEFSEILAKS